MSLNAFLSNPKAKRLLGFPAALAEAAALIEPAKASAEPVEAPPVPQAALASTEVADAPKARAKAGKKGAQ